jgi:hypothetical protein
MLSLLDTFQNKNFETLEVTTVVLTGNGLSKNYPKYTKSFCHRLKNQSVSSRHKITLATLKLYREHFK